MFLTSLTNSENTLLCLALSKKEAFVVDYTVSATATTTG
jgi:hypothetical protein